MSKAVKKLWDLSKDDLLQARIDLEEKEKRKRFFELEYAYDKGMEKGIEKEMEKGREEGRKESTEKAALGMLKNNADIRFVCKCTGLAKKQVLKLKNDLK